MTKAEMQKRICELQQKILDRESAIDSLIELGSNQDDKIRHYQYDIRCYQIKISDLEEKIFKLEEKLRRKEHS